MIEPGLTSRPDGETHGKRRRAASGKVLVLGPDNRIVLAIARSLGRRKLSVHVGWCHPAAPALRSAHIDRILDIPPFEGDDETWRRSLASVLDEERYDLVLPATEHTIDACRRQRAELERRAPIYLQPEATFEIVADKERTGELARRLGIPHPATTVIHGTEPSAAELGQVRLPVIVKPCRSVGRGVDKDYVRRASDLAELRDCVSEQLRVRQRVLVQEVVPGIGVGIELLARRGEILFAFQHARIHETSGYGSTYRESVALDDHLLEASTKLMHALGYTGVAMVEFRVDPRTGDWFLLEINGRFWGSLPLAVAAGADFPYYLYQLLVEDRRVFPPGYEVGLRCRNMEGDLRWFWANIGRRPDRGSAGWAVNRPSGWQLARDLARAAVFRDRIDSYAADDPRPAWFELRRLIRKTLQLPFRRLRSGS